MIADLSVAVRAKPESFEAVEGRFSGGNPAIRWFPAMNATKPIVRGAERRVVIDMEDSSSREDICVFHLFACFFLLPLL